MALTVTQVAEMLRQRGLTKSKDNQIVLRLIRQGLIKATMTSRKQGYVVEEGDLQAYIDGLNKPSIEELQGRIRDLESEVAMLQEKLSKYEKPKERIEITEEMIRDVFEKGKGKIPWDKRQHVLDKLLYYQNPLNSKFDDKYKNPYIGFWNNQKYGSPETMIIAFMLWLAKQG